MNLGPYELGPNDTPECGIYTGDARVLAEAIPDESVDLIFTDPVYQNIDDYRWLAETAARVLVSGGSVLAYTGTMYLDAVLGAMREYLTYRWTLIERKANSRQVIWMFHMFSQTRPLVWFSKGKPNLPSRYWSSFKTKLSEGSGNHKWSKGQNTVFDWIGVFDVGPVVLDTGCGGGTVPAVCKMLGRQYLAFEIDPATAALARERVRNTQPPLFVPQPEQLIMEVTQ